MEQQRSTTNVATGGPAQPEANTAQTPQSQHQIPSSLNDAKVSFLKPELLCVGLIGLFHNLSVFVIVLFFLIAWIIALNYVIAEEKKHPSGGHIVLGLKGVTVFQVVCYVLAHLIGSLLLVGCLIMDVLLRGSTDPVS